jgi:hypothetical protein
MLGHESLSWSRVSPMADLTVGGRIYAFSNFERLIELRSAHYSRALFVIQAHYGNSLAGLLVHGNSEIFREPL